MANGENEKVEVETVLGKFKAEAKSLNTLLTLGAFALGIAIAVLLWQHEQNNLAARQAFSYSLKEQTVALKDSVKEMIAAQRDMSGAIREQTCIMRFEQDQRQKMDSFCKQMAR